jgi:hypothetical protein
MNQYELQQVMNEIKRLTGTLDSASVTISRAIYLSAAGVSLVALSLFLVAALF